MKNNIMDIEKYSLHRFLGNVNKAMGCNRVTNESIFQNQANEDLEIVGEVNNFSKVINPKVLRLLFQKLEVQKYDEARDLSNNLLTKTSALKNV